MINKKNPAAGDLQLRLIVALKFLFWRGTQTLNKYIDLSKDRERPKMVHYMQQIYPETQWVWDKDRPYCLLSEENDGVSIYPLQGFSKN